MTKKTAVVTGGSTGIGASICRHLLDTDHHVVNLSRRKAEYDHENLSNFAVDLSDRAATKAVAKEVAGQFAVTVLVHNAGLIRPALIEEVDVDDLDYLTQVHLAADIILAQAFLPAMKEAHFGRIINITSRAALGLQTRTAYSATKSGMIGMSRTWALELAPHGITVNGIAPGPIAATEMFHHVMPEGDERIQKLADSIPVKRVGHPDDVANAVLFFASPESSFITGQTLFVCGGASIASISI